MAGRTDKALRAAGKLCVAAERLINGGLLSLSANVMSLQEAVYEYDNEIVALTGRDVLTEMIREDSADASL